LTSVSCLWSIGTIKWRARAAADGKPRCRQPGKRCAPHVTSTLSPRGELPTCWQIGKRGPFSGRRPFSGPPLPWKGAMGICRKCTRTIGACLGVDTRCGRSCITLIVALWMARRQRRAFSGGRSRISLKQCYLISRPCPNRGGENTKSYEVIEVIKCPALSGYPVPRALSMSPRAPRINAQRGARFDPYNTHNCLPPKQLRREIQ
jgi:hypothetical protein